MKGLMMGGKNGSAGLSSTDEFRDQLIQSAPEHASTIMARDAVVEKWCAEHGTTKDELTFEQILEIRKLPQWQDAT